MVADEGRTDALSDLTIIILAIIGGITAVVALKFTVSFNVNEFIKDRREWKQEVRIANARALCPHVDIVEEGGEPGIRSTYISPSGTTQWQCQKCGHTTYGRDLLEDNLQSWGGDIPGLLSRLKEFSKAAKLANLQGEG